MGMFDDIQQKFRCCFCGELQDGFQTKCFDCNLDMIDLEDVNVWEKYPDYAAVEIHSICNACTRTLRYHIRKYDMLGHE
jgi:hypothetical protein